MRKFGIEIEFGGSISDALAALHAEGLTRNTAQHGYVGFDADYWCVKTDASVRDGGELVSPPLDIDDPAQREQVTRAVKALKAAGCRTIPSAGIHIHIDGADLDAQQVAAVGRWFTKFEDCIYRIASSGWNTMRPAANSFCKPLTREQAVALTKVKNEDQLAKAYYNGTLQGRTGDRLSYRQSSHGDAARYFGLNLHSWFYRKTIEFRVFNSSLNPERIQGYLGMCMAIVQDARNGQRRSINKRYELGGMLAGTTNEANARHRFLQVLRYDGDMSLEDMKRLTKIWKDSKPQAPIATSLATYY